MTALLVCAVLCSAHIDPAPVAARPEVQPCRNGYCALSGIGLGTAYYKNIMERVAAFRGLAPGGSYAALPNCATIGRRFWARVQAPGGPWSRWTALVQADCLRPGTDWNTLTAHGTHAWVELGYTVARRLGVAGWGRFRVEIRLR